MKLFGQIIRTAVNIAALPVKAAQDVVDPDSNKGYLGHFGEAVAKLKREAGEE